MAVDFSGGSWSAPKQTALTGLPTAATASDGTPYVFVRDSSGAIRVLTGSSSGSGQAVSGGLDSVLPPGVAATADGRIAVVTAASPTRLQVAYSG